MFTLIKQNQYFVALLSIFFIAELFIAPVGNFPLNDDWSYAKAVLVFNEKAEFNFGVWPAMTLASHILWGSLFTKLFGFSHVVLRLSTLGSTIIALVFLYKLLVKSSHNKQLSAFGCALLLFNPIFFNLANTYMTDVNFCTLTILCIYFIYQFHLTGKIIYFLPVFFFSALLVLVRQFGLIVPVAFLVSCFFSREKKIRNILMALLVLAAVLVVLKIYEDYLGRILPRNSTYKFSGRYSIFARAFWDTFLAGANQKWRLVLLHILIYTFPFALVFLKSTITKAGLVRIVVTVLVSVFLSLVLFWNEYFPWQNIFTNMKVGPETLYQSTLGQHHAVSGLFGSIMTGIKFGGSAVTIFTIIMLVVQHSKRSESIKRLNPYMVFLAGYMVLYTGMLFITESDFDRYYLPLILCAIIIFAFCAREFKMNFKIALIPLVFMMYISIAGTKDYFTWNEKRWEAFNFLNKRCGINQRLINGGFEISCWTDTGFLISFDYLQIERANFIIQFDQPKEDFRLLQSFGFQRYFPFKKDKINIFVRQGNINLYDQPSSKKR